MATSYQYNFKSQEEFQQFAKEQIARTLVTYKNIVYDVTEFLDDHPGGAAYILDHKGKDITEVFHDEDEHEHSENALRMLHKYKVGKIHTEGDKKEEEVESYPKIFKDRLEFNEFTIDLTRGMVPQVWGLNKKQYLHMTHYPVHLPYCRLFDSDLFESLSRNPWYRIPLLWLPLVAYLLYYGLTFDYPEHTSYDKFLTIGSADFTVLGVLLTFGLGVFFWTLMEYTLHRAVFHFDEYLPDHPFALYLHFLIHGIHHVIPMDPDRLVFPPALGVIVYSILFPLAISLVPGNLGRIFVAGVAIGYICYDMTHIYIHHCTPFIGHFKEMKRYHNKHHYVDGNRAYGITTKFWDKVFRTEIVG